MFCGKIAFTAFVALTAGAAAGAAVPGDGAFADVLRGASAGEVVTIGENCVFSGVVTSRHDLVVRAADGVKPTVRVKSSARLVVVDGATVTVEGVTFASQEQSSGALFTVDGGALVLGAGATVTNLVTTASYGNISVLDGVLTMREGSLVASCRSRFTSDGADGSDDFSSGGVYLAGEGARLDMEGGAIVKCMTSRDGGGVFVGPGATVNVSGDATVAGNTSGSMPARANDIYLWSLDSSLVMAGELSGRIGVRYRTLDPDVASHNTNGFSFATTTLDNPATAACFFSDVDPLLVGAKGDGATLVWLKDDGTPRPLPDDEASAAVVRVTDLATGETANYLSFDAAVAAANAAGFADVRFDLLRDDVLREDAKFSAKTIALCAEAPGAVLGREGDFGLVVEGQTLVVTNVTFFGAQAGEVPFLTLSTRSRATFGPGAGMVGVTSRRQGKAPITVDSSTFVLEPGASLLSCTNAYRSSLPSGSKGCGGAIRLSSGNVVLRGGTISGCSAERGGGIYALGGSTVEIGGTVAFSDNVDGTGAPSNLAQQRKEPDRVRIVSKVDGAIGCSVANVDTTGAFATVSETWDWSAAPGELASSARVFVNDRSGERGCAVTNGTAGALFVWSNAVGADGSYAASANDVYYRVSDEALAPLTAAEPALDQALFTYNGQECRAASDGDGFVFEGATATKAGDYVARALVRDGFVWPDGTTQPREFAWTIAKASYDRSELAFLSADTFAYDGTAKTRELNYAARRSLGVQGVSVSYVYEKDGAVVEEAREAGVYTVTAVFSGDEENYEPIPDMTATLTILPEGGSGGEPGEPEPEDPEEPEEPVVIPCVPFAFTAIARDASGAWRLTVSPVVAGCSYELETSEDGVAWTAVPDATLTPAADGEAAFSVPSATLLRFWRAVGRDGQAAAE